MQKTVWTSIRLPSPRLISATEASSAKKERLATAVMISGTMSGRFMTMKEAVWPGQRRVRVVARAAAVATKVETMVAVIVIFSVFSAAAWNPALWNAATYQLRPKPLQRVIDGPELKENIVKTRIGA